MLLRIRKGRLKRIRNSSRVPTACVLLFAWQLTADRTADLPAGYRGWFRKSGWRGEGGDLP